MMYLIIFQWIMIAGLCFLWGRHTVQINVLSELLVKILQEIITLNNYIHPRNRISLEDFFESNDELAR